MPTSAGAAGERPALDVAGLRATLAGAKRLVVFAHDNPDPDAIASAWLLGRIAESLGVRARLVYGGRLGRAENRMMVRLLHVPLRPLDGRLLPPRRADRYALVDTQPGTGNNSFPPQLHCHLVFDHHPAHRGATADLYDVRPGDGCTTTLLLGWFEAFGLALDSRLATAIAYAIVSETQDLKREATRADREALHRVLPRARLTDLGRIRHPVRGREYYETVARALGRVELGRSVCVCHIGTVGTAEVVAEIADLLSSMERVAWCLVTGCHEGVAVVSLRTSRAHARSERVMRVVLGRSGRGGGHGMIAGGTFPCAEPGSYPRITAGMTERFLRRVDPAGSPVLHPLLVKPDSGCPPGPDDAEASVF
jgi:nanoRNase/pAp phosphatase (c-di-AMP/oligoRNAs hydrolase)